VNWRSPRTIASARASFTGQHQWFPLSSSPIPSFREFAQLLTEPQLVDENLDLSKGKDGKQLLQWSSRRASAVPQDCRNQNRAR
jgi:hypothetical protein